MRSFFRDLNKLRPLFDRRDKWKFVILFGLMFLGSLLETVGIGAIPAFVSLIMKPSSLSEFRWIGDMFTGLPDEPSIQLVFWASLALLLFIISKNIFLVFVYYVQARVVVGQRVLLSDRMFRVYQSAPYQWHLQRSSAELLRNIQNDTAKVLSNVLMPFLDLVMAITMAVSIVTLLVVNTPSAALMGFMITAIGLFIVIRLFQKRLRNIGGTLWREASEILKSIQQGFGALVDARILGHEAYLNKVHKAALLRQAKAERHQILIARSTPFAIETFAIAGLLTILLILIKTSENLASILPLIALLGVATLRLKQIATRLASSINLINVGRAFIPGIMNDLKELTTIEKEHKTRHSGKQKIEAFEALSIESVQYSYPNSDLPALNDISLQLNRGESIALVGATGCGKSTLVNAILGLLEPESGRILVNGVNIFQDLEGWRTHLGYIQQSIYLIDDTIRANVAFCVPQDEVDDEHLWATLRSARLEEFIHTLPEGLDTIVGERGVRLSGGQRQRLGIARALYPNPEVLIMDEATSALDNKTEVEVMQAIQNLKKDRTLIMIAHRLSTVKDCDRLHFLRNGKMEDYGTYAELQKSSTDFHEMTVGCTAR